MTRHLTPQELSRLTPQQRLVLNHLRSRDPYTGEKLTLSPMEAIGLYRIMRLPNRISELRQMGYPIDGRWKIDLTGKRYKRYSLNE